MKSSHCCTETERGFNCSMFCSDPQCSWRKIFCKGWILGANSNKFKFRSMLCRASTSYLLRNRSPFPATAQDSLIVNQRSALYIIRIAELIAIVACRTSSKRGSPGNDLSMNVDSKKFINTVVNSPLCQIPHGKFREVGQAMHSFEIFWIWHRWLFEEHHAM